MGNIPQDLLEYKVRMPLAYLRYILQRPMTKSIKCFMKQVLIRLDETYANDRLSITHARKMP